MTAQTRDTLVELDRRMPVFFTFSAWLLPVGIGAQFLLAGQSLFNGLPWNLHGMVGGLVALPVLALIIGASAIRYLRGFGWWAGVLAGLYVLQIGLAASGTAALSLHPFNAALLLAASLVMLAKVERRRGHHGRL